MSDLIAELIADGCVPYHITSHHWNWTEHLPHEEWNGMLKIVSHFMGNIEWRFRLDYWIWFWFWFWFWHGFCSPLYIRGDRNFLGQLRRGECHNGSCERGDLFKRRDRHRHYEGGTWKIFSSIIILWTVKCTWSLYLIQRMWALVKFFGSTDFFLFCNLDLSWQYLLR